MRNRLSKQAGSAGMQAAAVDRAMYLKACVNQGSIRYALQAKGGYEARLNLVVCNPP
jgi:hypothetical protein